MKERVKSEDRRYFSSEEKQKILNKSRGKCCHCGKPLVIGDNFSIEHVIPISKGGTNDISNLVGLCKDCNKEKSNYIMLPSDYYRYLNRVYLEELLKNHKKYCSDTNWITFSNAFTEDVFTIEANCKIKSDSSRMIKGGGDFGVRCKVKRVFRKAVYSDLDSIYNFYVDYARHYKSSETKESIKEFISEVFTKGVIYFMENKNGSIGLVMFIDFAQVDGGFYVLASRLLISPKNADKKSIGVLCEMVYNFYDKIFSELGKDLPCIWECMSTFLKADKASKEVCELRADIPGPKEELVFQSEDEYSYVGFGCPNKSYRSYIAKQKVDGKETYYAEGATVYGVILSEEQKEYGYSNGFAFLKKCLERAES